MGRGKGKNPGNFLHERGSICPEKIKKACLHPAEGGDTLYDKYRVLITISTECWKGISNANYELRTKTKTKTKNSFTLIYTREILTTENTLILEIESPNRTNEDEYPCSLPPAGKNI